MLNESKKKVGKERIAESFFKTVGVVGVREINGLRGVTRGQSMASCWLVLRYLLARISLQISARPTTHLMIVRGMPPHSSALE